jgi:hypothetical protein
MCWDIVQHFDHVLHRRSRVGHLSIIRLIHDLDRRYPDFTWGSRVESEALMSRKNTIHEEEEIEDAENTRSKQFTREAAANALRHKRKSDRPAADGESAPKHPIVDGVDTGRTNGQAESTPAADPTFVPPAAPDADALMCEMVDIRKAIPDQTDNRFRAASAACKALNEKVNAVERDVAVIKDWRKRVDGMLNLAYYAAMRMHEQGIGEPIDKTKLKRWSTRCEWEDCPPERFGELCFFADLFKEQITDFVFQSRLYRALGETETLCQRLSAWASETTRPGYFERKLGPVKQSV